MAALLISLLAGAGVVGLALVALGLRGRRVGDHPHCRRCGHDLFGTPGGICGECGADLSRPKATRAGRFERRRGLLVTGLGLLVPALLVAAALATLAALGYDWNRAKPGWWLVGDLSDEERHAAAVGELRRRQDAGGLPAATAADAADRLLVRQADESAVWHQTGGVLLERLREDGLLDDAHPPGGDEPLRMQVYGLSGQWTTGQSIPGTVTAGWPVGVYELPLTLELEAAVDETGEPPNPAHFLDMSGPRLPGEVVGRRTVRRVVTVKVLPADAPQPLVLTDPADAPAADAVRPWAVPADVAADVASGMNAWVRRPAVAGLAIDAAVYPLLELHDAHARTVGGRVKLHLQKHLADSSAETFLIAIPRDDGSGDDPFAGAAAVDVVLVPNSEAVLYGEDASPAWHGEVRIPNVPVSRP